MIIHLLAQLNALVIVLASASPRRLALLHSIGLHSVIVHPSAFPELLPHSSHTPSSYAIATSQAKARTTLSALSSRLPLPDLIIAADTVVAVDGAIWEKPLSEADACAKLAALSARSHSVVTGVTLLKRNGVEESFSEETVVTFGALSAEVIRAYVGSGEPMDKAGGYGIQGMAAQFVRGISGDYANVVGLPLHALCAHLEAFVQPLIAAQSAARAPTATAVPSVVTADREEQRVAYLQSLIVGYPDWPVAGVLFRDIFPLFQHPRAITVLFDLFTHHIASTFPHVDVIVGLDARGFLIGAAIAPRLNAAFVPIRKAGKLPGPTLSTVYTKEYGADSMQMQRGAIHKAQRVVIVDDVLATGGTLQGAVDLCRAAEAEVLQCVVLIELRELRGRAAIGADVRSFIQYDG